MFFHQKCFYAEFIQNYLLHIDTLLTLVKTIIPTDKLPWSLPSKLFTTPQASVTFKSFIEIIFFEVVVLIIILFCTSRCHAQDTSHVSWTLLFVEE